MSAVRAPAAARPASRPRARGEALGWAAAVGALALAALFIADDAGVAGPAAVPDLARALAASLALLALCGFPLARLLVPESLAPWRPLLVLPLGAAGSALALTLLGFAAVPFEVSLPLLLVLGAAACVATARRPRPGRAGPGATVAPGTPAGPRTPAARLAGLAAIGALIVALALVPSFRSGIATMTGFGSDAHQVAGTAFLLQHAYPTERDDSLPVDAVTPAWRSKYPIYYSLAAVSSLAGLETWEATMTFAALILVLGGVGFFLLARITFGAALGVAAVAGAVAILDQRVFHLALHPYYNQLWGLFTLPFSLLFAHVWLEQRSWRPAALLGLFTLLGAFAYPLMLPFPALAIAGAWLVDRRERRSRGEEVARPELRRLWRGRRSLLWMVPAGVVLLVPIAGVLEKLGEGVRLIANIDTAIEDWQGDLSFHPPVGEFLAVADVPLRPFLAGALCLLALAALWRAPRRVGLPLAVTLLGAGAGAGFFAALRDGQYLYFKVLAFAGPLIVVAAVVALGSLHGRLRPLGMAGLALLSVSALAGARDEIGQSYDQLSPQTLELREWSRRLPAAATIRLDTPPASQLWQAYVLSERRLGSRRPDEHYPHVPRSAGADYAIDWTGRRPPADRAGRPLLANSRYRLWRLDGSGGRDRTSRRQTFSGALGVLPD